MEQHRSHHRLTETDMKTKTTNELFNYSLCLAIVAVAATGCASSKIAGLSNSGPPVKLIDRGWKASWSPDGRQIVFGTGEGEGLGIFDLRTRRTTPLIARGKDPAWSPGGKLIAFVREESYNNYLTEEVWVVPPAGGQASRVTQGGFPGWAGVGPLLYIHERRGGRILAINPTGQQAEPKVICQETPSWYFAVSPDSRQVAFGANGGLQIRESASSKLVRTWPTAGERGSLPAWSPDGRWVAFGGFDNSRLGLWVLEVSTGRAARIASGPCTMPAWSKDGKWLAYDERHAEGRSIWVVGQRYIDQVFHTDAQAAPETQ
jgi:Tol biopolymer transport system component